MNTPEFLWQNTEQYKKTSFLYEFIENISEKYKENFSGYHDFYLWSVKNLEVFWQEFLVYSNIILHQDYEKVLKKSDVFNLNRWFYQARLNFAENLLDSSFNKNRQEREPNYPALIALNEQGGCTKYTIADIKRQVVALVNYFNSIGIKPGDRVVGVIPNIGSAVIAMLATTAVGAVWSACSPDFGETGTLDRFAQIEPSVILVVDGYYYKNKYFDCSAKNISIINTLSEHLKSVISVTENYPISTQLAALEKEHVPYQINTWVQIQEKFNTTKTEQIKYHNVDFNDPVYIMFSSGTTGKPKCIVHGVGGILLEHFKEHLLHHNISSKDNFFYFTTTSWMMWHWQISAIGLGATVLIYDGAPNHPDNASLMQLIDDYQITAFGASAKYFSALEKSHVKSADNSFSLRSLRILFSTGSPLLPEQYHYIYQNIKSDVALCSISGGTDIIGCFALGNPLLPVYIGQLQSRSLGLDVRFYNEYGHEVVGEKSELVCLQPFPSMPIYFWGDADGAKYQKAYFNKFTNIWAHGDYGELTQQQGVIIYGRSDAVLNPGGVRIGTAEIYAEVEKVAEVMESLAVGQVQDGDERIILFVVLRDKLQLDVSIKTAIINQIKHGATPRHVPAVIIQTPELPRTTSGKLVELAVKDVLAGREVKNKDSLANPWALDYFANLKELQH